MISIETSNLLFFVSASLLLIIAPGPDIVFLITQGVTRGPRVGFATALGLAAGNLVHTIAAALGVSVIFRTSPVAFQALKIAGVAYLLFLAWKTLRRSKRSTDPIDPSDRQPVGSVGYEPMGLFWRGLLMNVLNPKVALFFLAFLPQFVSRAAGPIWTQMLLYGASFTILVVIVFGSIGIFSGRMGSWLFRGGASRFQGGMRWIIAGVYVALAAKLALASG